MVESVYNCFFLKVALTQTSSHECDWLTHSLSQLSLPHGKQEVAEMCFLLECETASLAKEKGLHSLCDEEQQEGTGFPHYTFTAYYSHVDYTFTLYKPYCKI